MSKTSVLKGILAAKTYEELGNEFKKVYTIILSENNCTSDLALGRKFVYTKEDSADTIGASTISGYFGRAQRGEEKGKISANALLRIKEHKDFGENSALYQICSNYNKKYDELCDYRVRSDENYTNEVLKNFIGAAFNNKDIPSDYITLNQYKDLVQDDDLIYPTATIFISLLFFPNLSEKLPIDLQGDILNLIKLSKTSHNDYLSYLPATHIEHLVSREELMSIRDVALAKIGKDKLTEIYNILKKDQKSIGHLKKLVSALNIKWSTYPKELGREAIYSSDKMKHINDHNYICKVSCPDFFLFPLYID